MISKLQCHTLRARTYRGSAQVRRMASKRGGIIGCSWPTRVIRARFFETTLVQYNYAPILMICTDTAESGGALHAQRHQISSSNMKDSAKVPIPSASMRRTSSYPRTSCSSPRKHEVSLQRRLVAHAAEPSKNHGPKSDELVGHQLQPTGLPARESAPKPLPWLQQ